MSAKYEPSSALGRFVHGFEETAIAVILGLMTVITFVNVIMRYLFNTSLIWGLELTSALFAWLVLIGISYAVKVTANLGVDAITNMLPAKGQRVLALIAALLCIVYAALLMKGAWDYFAPFAGFEQTSGRIIPTGFKETRDQAWYETEQIPMPDILRFMEGMFNQGEPYDKLPRFALYFMLPLGCGLLLFRFLQAGWEIVIGKRASLIVSHEAEEAVEDVRHMNIEE